MLFLAYDGSLHGDWLARYAVRFAANTLERRLRLVHVADATPPLDLEERIARMGVEARRLGVELEVELAPRRGAAVAERLLELVPGGATLIAGAPAQRGRRARLRGSVPARLLGAGRFAVIAVRVVRPGVLGQPGSVLLPVAGGPDQARAALPLLRLLGDDLQRLHVLLVRGVSGLRSRLMSRQAAEVLLAEGHALVASVEDELRGALAPRSVLLDSSVVLSEAPGRDILLGAARHHAHLVALGARRPTSPGRRDLGLDLPLERLLREAPTDVAVCWSLP